MAKIKKIYDDKLSPENPVEIYPITSTQAVYNTENVTVDALIAEGYRFGGLVEPTDSPALSDTNQRAFYFATKDGIYPNFGNQTVENGRMSIFLWNGSAWGKQSLAVGSANIAGYKVLASVNDLPRQATNLGYLIEDDTLPEGVENQFLYVWVGEGGDTLEGMYQNCGQLRGASAYEVARDNGYEGTQEEWLNDPVNGIKGVGISKWELSQSTTDSGVSTITVTLNTGDVETFDVYNGKGIASVEVVGSESSADSATNTYRVTYSDGNHFDFHTKNGKGIASIAIVGSYSDADGATNTYRVTYSDGNHFDFNVKNGNKGDSGYSGAAGELEVVNSLNSTDATAALSAAQGKVLKDLHDTDKNIVNVNDLNGTPTTAYGSADLARAAVNALSGLRITGQVITYLLADGWHTEQFIGSDVTNWTTASNWLPIAPITVSQNSQTGKTELLIGNTPALIVDDEPTAGSRNLVESGGVADKTEPIEDFLFGRNRNYSLIGNNTLKEISVAVRTGYKITITATEWTEGLKAQIRYKDKQGNIHYLDGPHTGGLWEEQGDERVFIADEDWVAVSLLRYGGTTGSYNVTFATEIASDIKDIVSAGGLNLVNSKGIYINNSNTKFLLGQQINDWNQGVPDSENPYNPTTNSIRICSLANIAYKNAKLIYEVPQGYKIIIASWDGLNISTYNESTWITGKGVYVIENAVFNILLGYTNDAAITPSSAPNLYISSPFSEAEQSKQFKTTIPLGMIQLDGTSKGNTLNTYNFVGAQKGKTYRLYLNQTNWATPSIASYYAKFVFGYVDNSGVETDFVSRALEQTLESYYDVVIPNNINLLGELYVKIRGAQEEPLLFFIREIDTSNFGKRLVNSKIFKSCGVAWVDKNHQYESWPNGGVMADGNRIIIVYNSSSAHVATDLVSDVMMRTKTTLGDWDEKRIILEHTSNVGYGNPSCCILPNGDYLVTASILTVDTVSQQVMKIKMVKSSDKGVTWTDMGNVQVGGVDVEDECMQGLFCTSTGKLISFVGGKNNNKFIVSDDNGETWRFVGNSFYSALEACFYERSNGEIVSILRQNQNTPALIKLNADLTSYEILYGFGTFNFPAYYNPTSIIKLLDGTLYLLGGSREQDGDGHYLLYESIVTENELLSNNIKSRVISKAKATTLMDWGYAQAVIAEDGTIYGYFYDSEGTVGTTQIYEMLGC